MNVQEGKLKYDYSKLDEFLTLSSTKDLARYYNSLVYAFTDLLAIVFNHYDDIIQPGSQIDDEAAHYTKYLGELFQVLEDLPENKDWESPATEPGFFITYSLVVVFSL